MSYVTLKGYLCDIVVMNGHAATESEDDVLKDRIYEELEKVFDQFPKYNMKNLIGDFNAMVGR
jgi:hypothetical protein